MPIERHLLLLASVRAQFGSLESEFKRSFGDAYRLDMLLPHSDGWFIPVAGLYPFPLRRWPLQNIPLFSIRATKNYLLDNTPGLHEIDVRVLGRCMSNRLLRRTVEMIDSHIKKATEELQDLQGGSDVAECDSTWRNAKFGLYVWRLSWLEAWQEAIQPYAADNKRNPKSQASILNFEALIKPLEMESASKLIVESVTQLAELPYFLEKQFELRRNKKLDRKTLNKLLADDLLVLWYSRLLWQLGAGWRELLQIIGTVPIRRKSSRRKRRRRTWKEVTQKRIKDGVRYDVSKEDE